MAASIYLTKEELKTKIYEELLDIITRADDTIVEEEIHAAIDMAKGYLGRYDINALFGIEPSTPPTFTAAPGLKAAVKDIVVFNLASLANANYDMTVLNQRKEDAMRWLREIQAGKSIPHNWPLKDTTEDTYPEGNQVSGFFNDKRENLI